MDLSVCNSEESSVVSSMPAVTTCLELAWHGFDEKQMDQVPFLRTLGDDVHLFNAVPKSSSDNRISRELGACKTLSLLSSNNCCGNCASTSSMEI